MAEVAEMQPPARAGFIQRFPSISLLFTRRESNYFSSFRTLNFRFSLNCSAQKPTPVPL
ncbi:MAG: hypothetical protein RSC06_02115 [Clostridia bacterium]